MNSLHPIINWLLFDTIVGIGSLAALVYLISSKFNRRDMGFKIALIVFFVGLFTLPSVPRYQFEQDVISNQVNKPWVKIAKTHKGGDIAEPLTWFMTPVQTFILVMPESSSSSRFLVTQFTYKEPALIRLAIPDCKVRSVSFFAMDNQSGKYAAFKEAQNKEMFLEEYKLLCLTDWSEEKRALGAKGM